MALVACLAAGTSVAPATATPAQAPPAPADPRGGGGGDVTAGVSVTGTYTVLTGDFGGDSHDDLIFYAPGSGADAIWLSDGDGTFTKQALSKQVNGTYTPIVGDFAGDDRSDILWYAPGPGADSLWTSVGSNAWLSSPVSVNGTYQPVVLRHSRYGPAKDWIVWLGPTGASGVWWRFADGTRTSHPFSLLGAAKPVVGNFDGDADDDVVWWGPGGLPDVYWHTGTLGWLVTGVTINGSTYRPAVVDADTSDCPDCDDIVWFAPGSANDTWWEGLATGDFSSHATTIPGGGTPFGLRNPAGDDVVQIWDPGVSNRFWYLAAGVPTIVTAPRFLAGTGYTPIVGDFVGTTQDVFWYKPGSAPEHLVWT